MKKILVLAIVAMFSLLIVAVDTSKTIDTEKNVFDYMDANGIEYEINEEGALKELPKDANVLTIEYVQEFIESVMNTKTVTVDSFIKTLSKTEAYIEKDSATFAIESFEIEGLAKAWISLKTSKNILIPALSYKLKAFLSDDSEVSKITDVPLTK